MIYIALEGTDFIGKDTVLERFKDNYTNEKLIYTREPGGSPLGQKIREIILDTNNTMDSLTESLLFAADRSIHIKDLKKQVDDDSIIISNRTYYSSLVYQANNVNEYFDIQCLNDYATRGLKPTHLIIFYIEDEDKFVDRVSLSDRGKDRIESKGTKYLYNINKKYKELYDTENENHFLIECSGDKEQVYNQFIKAIEKIFSKGVDKNE